MFARPTFKTMKAPGTSVRLHGGAGVPLSGMNFAVTRNIACVFASIAGECYFLVHVIVGTSICACKNGRHYSNANDRCKVETPFDTIVLSPTMICVRHYTAIFLAEL